MKHDRDGEPLYHCLIIRIFDVNNAGKLTKRFVAGPGQGYSEEAIEKMVDHVADDLERRRPEHDYELVQIAPASFNFVWRGWRAVRASQETAKA